MERDATVTGGEHDTDDAEGVGPLHGEVEALRARLQEAEDTLHAIRTGEVDALVVRSVDGPRTYTLNTADQSYRLLVEQMSDGALTLATDGLILYSNARLAALLKLPGTTLAGARLSELAHPDDRERLDDLLRRAAGGEAIGEIRLRSADGMDIPVQLSLNAFRSSDFDGVCAIVSDITERKRREDRERLLEAERRARGRLTEVLDVASLLSAVLSPRDVGPAIVTAVRVAMRADAAWVVLLTDDGTEIEVVAADPPLGADDVARVPVDAPSAASTAIASREVVVFGSMIERARIGGRQGFGFSAGMAVPLLAGDRALGALVVGNRVERAWADDEVALLTALADQCVQALERARLYESEQRARTEAEESNKAKSDFLAVMSHELRTPLNAIGGHLELIEIGVYGPLNDAQREALDRVQRNQRNLLTLINQILDFARVEAGRIEYALSDLRLTDAIDSLGPLIEAQLAGKGLAYEVQMPDPSPLVSVDAEKLEQILLNLLTNAAKFTEAGGRIVISVATRDGVPRTVFLRVSDTGRGIPTDKLSAIFEPFVRVRTGLTAPTDGVGLGLAIARDLARGMGADLRARSAVGEGSTFTLSLPAASQR